MNPLRTLMMIISRVPPAAMLVAVIGLAAIISLLVTNSINAERDKLRIAASQFKIKNTETGMVVYSTRDISAGQTISGDALEERPVDRAKIPVDSLSSTSMAIGRIAKYGIPSASLVSTHDLTIAERPQGFESRLRPGMRAITFAVDANSGVGGFVAPESHVDIMAMVGSGTETRSCPILSDVEIIAVGQTYQKVAGASSAMPASCVTVAVNPADTQKLLRAINASKLYLALRPEHDRAPVPTADVTALFAKPASQSASPVALLPKPSLQIEPVMSHNNSTVKTHQVELWFAGRKNTESFP